MYIYLQYDSKVSPDNLFYDCGVALSPEGLVGHQDCMKFASCGTCTLHSLYLLLWANFGAFCITLLTQPDSDNKLCGRLISDNISVRSYCLSQLKTLWMHIRNSLYLTEEERSFFVTTAMTKLEKVKKVA